ncbi:hypothetical protein B0H16DRAFT_1477672 [Mycena metata]|uniref:Uncharacterized protein n=1 Tax=Mycena metata TaxID=1033252 RepID=A0AAD7H8H7_9AGAR|nr:hypothetical protein B0H16DRAFT_1477672 [Mycena metata]
MFGLTLHQHSCQKVLATLDSIGGVVDAQIQEDRDTLCLLFTGSTGSGKTFAMAQAVRDIARRLKDQRIVTSVCAWGCWPIEEEALSKQKTAGLAPLQEAKGQSQSLEGEHKSIMPLETLIKTLAQEVPKLGPLISPFREFQRAVALSTKSTSSVVFFMAKDDKCHPLLRMIADSSHNFIELPRLFLRQLKSKKKGNQHPWDSASINVKNSTKNDSPSDEEHNDGNSPVGACNQLSTIQIFKDRGLNQKQCHQQWFSEESASGCERGHNGSMIRWYRGMAVSVLAAIKVKNVRLDDILARHADGLEMGTSTTNFLGSNVTATPAAGLLVDTRPEKMKQRHENCTAGHTAMQNADGCKIKQQGLEHAEAATAKKSGEHAQPNIPTVSSHNLDNEALKDPCFRIIKADPTGICSSRKVVIDTDNCVLILAVLQPAEEKNWKKVTEDVSTAVDNAAKEIDLWFKLQPGGPNLLQRQSPAWAALGAAYRSQNGRRIARANKHRSKYMILWFNHELGGHLIMWDLWLIIEFPLGMTIVIPLAIFRHSNVSIQQDEKWFSIMQYTSAGIFPFIDNSFKTNIIRKNLPRVCLQ